MRDGLERALQAWGHWVFGRAWLMIAVVVLGTLPLLAQLRHTTVDTSSEGFLHPHDPIMLTYRDFREQFGRDDALILAIGTDDAFSAAFLTRLRALHEDIEENVPRVEDVQSLVNARETRGEGDELIVGELLEDWPEGADELADLRARVLANPIYRNILISEDGRMVTVVIRPDVYSQLGDPDDALSGFEDVTSGDAAMDAADALDRPFLTGEENAEIVRAVQVVTDRHSGEDFEIQVAGMPRMMVDLQDSMQRDMGIFTGLSIVVIGAMLFALFRRKAGVILPLVIVIFSVLATMGTMAATRTPLTLPTQILPSLLLAVGVGSVVHILVMFCRYYDAGQSKQDSIAGALAHSGVAVVFTSLTTAGGLVSFSAAEIAPISHFGIFAPVGVLMALVYTILLLPPLIAVFPVRRRPVKEGAGPGHFQRALVACGDFATRRAGLVVAVAVVLVGLSALGIRQIHFSHDPLQWFPVESPMRRAVAAVDQNLGGSLFLEIWIDSGEQDGLMDPDLMRRLDEIRRYAARVSRNGIYVGKTISLVDVSKEIHQALNENRPEFYVLPESRELLSQEFLLFEGSGSDDLEELVDSQFRATRFTFKLPWADAFFFEDLFEDFDRNIAAILADSASFRLTGLMTLMGRTISAMMISMAKSYVVALFIITPLMIFLIGHLRIGLLSMVPNLLPITLTLGFMGWMGIPLDAFTLLIGSIAIGLAVDDTIHFMDNFRRYYARGETVLEAVSSTLSTTGIALLFTTLVLSFGFLVYTLSDLQSLIHFGGLTAMTLAFAFVADVVLAPALLTLVLPESSSGTQR